MSTPMQIAALLAHELRPAPVTVTLKQVKAACRAYKDYQTANRAKEQADTAKKEAAMIVFQALLGFKSEEQVRTVSPEKLKRLARRRIRAGLVDLQGIEMAALLDQVIQKSKSERRPSWKDAFVQELGEPAAIKVQAATAESFSYKFVDSSL